MKKGLSKCRILDGTNTTLVQSVRQVRQRATLPNTPDEIQQDQLIEHQPKRETQP
jgi:hypothetical protein